MVQVGDKPKLHPGDHVVRWIRPPLGSKFLPLQQHGIILDMVFDLHINDWILTVADFSRYQRAHYAGRPSNVRLSFRGHHIAAWRTPATSWVKVEYGSQNYEKIFSWAGTSTSIDSDPTERVLARALYLLSSPSRTKRVKLALVHCSESLSLWCKTGCWNTLQGASWAHIMRSDDNDTATVQAGVAFFSALSHQSFLRCLGPQTQRSLGYGFPMMVSICTAGQAAMNGVMLRWIRETLADEAPGETEN